MTQLTENEKYVCELVAGIKQRDEQIQQLKEFLGVLRAEIVKGQSKESNQNRETSNTSKNVQDDQLKSLKKELALEKLKHQETNQKYNELLERDMRHSNSSQIQSNEIQLQQQNAQLQLQLQNTQSQLQNIQSQQQNTQIQLQQALEKIQMLEIKCNEYEKQMQSEKRFFQSKEQKFFQYADTCQNMLEEESKEREQAIEKMNLLLQKVDSLHENKIKEENAQLVFELERKEKEIKLYKEREKMLEKQIETLNYHYQKILIEKQQDVIGTK
eukprot:c13314_g1_i1.p1 GENE.c13314_g1_i1~~c13314_g1_i1.p1  ORF type:complete len:271 (+),score=86.40 c13314_g1_i1:1-813(+)